MFVSRGEAAGSKVCDVLPLQGMRKGTILFLELAVLALARIMWADIHGQNANAILNQACVISVRFQDLALCFSFILTLTLSLFCKVSTATTACTQHRCTSGPS